MIHGQSIYYQDGELSFFKTVVPKKNAKKHKGIFLEELELHMKIINKNDKIQLVPKDLVSERNV